MELVSSQQFRKDPESLNRMFKGYELLKVKLFTKKVKCLFKCQNTLEFFNSHVVHSHLSGFSDVFLSPFAVRDSEITREGTLPCSAMNKLNTNLLLPEQVNEILVTTL